MNTYTWSIGLTECFLEKFGFEKAIKTIYYEVNATNGTTAVSETSSVELEVQQNQTFIPFDDVTNEIALGWVFDKLGTEKQVIEDKLDNLIVQIENPETVFLPLNEN